MIKWHTFLILVLFLALALTGCGKKVWPEPDVDQEKFSLSILEHEVFNGCINILVNVAGNYRNVARLTIELEESDEPCPACPFLPTASFPREPGSAGMTRANGQIRLTHCGLDQDKYYRFRIRASNIYSIIRDERSEVIAVSR